METNVIIQGDCLEVMRGMEDNCVDTIITDPPYGLSFMGKKWDYNVPAIEIWQEALRVLKPGGTLLCFAGTRTYHRMVCNIEDAGFIPKDCIMWLYGSGFPKATDISKQIDKVNGEPERLHKFTKWMRSTGITAQKVNDITDTFMGSHYLTSKEQPAIPTVLLWSKLRPHIKTEIPLWVDELVDRIEAERKIIGKHNAPAKEIYQSGELSKDVDITEPATEAAKVWNGWKSHGLKPAYEPILVAMKPNDGTYAENALRWGVAGLNIDAGRIATDEPIEAGRAGRQDFQEGWGYNGQDDKQTNDKGRYPANVILDEEAGRMLDEQSGVSKSNIRKISQTEDTHIQNKIYGNGYLRQEGGCNDTGGASRFFYCAKASKSERNEGCEGIDPKVKDAEYRQPTGNAMVDRIHGCGKKLKNHHPTVKPLDLMKYLCRITSTPTSGLVLDPFAGSGTTLVACELMGRRYIGIEISEEYCEIARKRVQEAKDSMALFP